MVVGIRRMPLALERIGGPGIAGPGTACFTVYETAAPPLPADVAACSSSIGRDSDCSAARAEEDGAEEVQSRLKGPLETLDALEDSLPIRRGISNFYCGKSKSFTSLADAINSSAKDLGKQENAYTRKRKNILAFNGMWDRSHDNLIGFAGGGTPKRLANSNRSTSSLMCTTSSSGSNSNSSGEEEHEPSRHLPPLHPRAKPPAASTSTFPQCGKSSFPLRSFSMTDLQGVAPSSFPFGPKDEHKRFY